MYTVIEHTPFYVYGIVTLFGTIYLPFAMKGMLSFKIVTSLMFFSLSITFFLIEPFNNIALFIMKYIWTSLGLIFIVLGIYNKIKLRIESDKTIW